MSLFVVFVLFFPYFTLIYVLKNVQWAKEFAGSIIFCKEHTQINDYVCNPTYKLFCTFVWRCCNISMRTLQSGTFMWGQASNSKTFSAIQSSTSANATSQLTKHELPVLSMLFSNLIYCDSWILSTDPFDPNVFLRKLQCNLWNDVLLKDNLPWV